MKRCKIKLGDPPAADEIKILVMMTRPQNILREKNVLRPCHHYQKLKVTGYIEC